MQAFTQSPTRCTCNYRYSYWTFMNHVSTISITHGVQCCSITVQHAPLLRALVSQRVLQTPRVGVVTAMTGGRALPGALRSWVASGACAANVAIRALSQSSSPHCTGSKYLCPIHWGRALPARSKGLNLDE